MKTTFTGLLVLHFSFIGTSWKSFDSGHQCSYQSCESDRRNCRCDSLCPYFRDCCKDFNGSVSVRWENQFPPFNYLRCRSIPGYWKDEFRMVTNCPERTYWMVSQCPATASKTLKEQCEKEYSTKDLVEVGFLRPVHDALGNVFKNYFCAKCHDIPSEETTLWSVDQVCNQCPEELPLSQSHYVNLSSPHCDVLLKHQVKSGQPNASFDGVARLRECDKNMINSCPLGSNANDTEQCSEFMSPGYFKGSYFKNIYCAKCNGMANLNSWSCEVLMPWISMDCQASDVNAVSYGMSFFDPLCSLIRCSRPNNLCESSDSTDQYILMVVDDDFKCAYLEDRAEQCFFHKSTLRNSTLSWKRMVGTNTLVETNKPSKHEVIAFQLPKNTSTDWRIIFDIDLVENARQLSQTDRSCYLEFIEVFEVCSDQEWAQLGECSGELLAVEGDGILDDNYFLTELKLNFTYEMVPVWYSVHTRFPFEPRSFAQRRTLVCFTYLGTDQRSVWYKIFCGICIGVAVLSHLATFVTYALFKPLRNTFGVCLMSFVLSLAVALFLQEFVNDYVINIPYLCTTVAIVSHFFWLASFTWMTVLAWDLRATLSITKVRVRKPYTAKRFGAYNCFGWGVPLLIVGGCIILWLSQLDGLHFKYGSVRDFTCWISDNVIVLAAVGGPLVLCLLADALLFFMIGRSLYKHKKSRKILDTGDGAKQHKTKVIELIVYLKISILLGTSWLFGILADYTKVEVLWLAFYLSYLVQAVLIFCFFGLSPRARKMWNSTSSTSTKFTSGRMLSDSK